MFNAQRLAIARQRRGMTKQALAAEIGIAPRAVTLYEQGTKVPDADTIAKLGACLAFPIEFFERDDLPPPALTSTSFRALSRMTARTRDRALSVGATALAFSNWIDERFATPVPDVPHYEDLEPELAAAALRRHWRIGERPVANLTHLVELHGVRLFSLPLDLTDVDAYSFWLDRRPYIALNMHKSAEHSRLDIAHELGHLTMHWQGIERSRSNERDAQRFGSAFLMPPGDIIGHCPRNATLSQIIDLKHRWGVSVAALAYRLHQLDMLTDSRYRSLFVQINTRGFHKAEPQPRLPEFSAVLQAVFAANSDEGRGHADIAHDLAISLDDLHEITFGLAAAVRLGPLPRNGDSQRGRTHPKNFRVISTGHGS